MHRPKASMPTLERVGPVFESHARRAFSFIAVKGRKARQGGSPQRE